MANPQSELAPANLITARASSQGSTYGAERRADAINATFGERRL
jgi:hypothetical protein